MFESSNCLVFVKNFALCRNMGAIYKVGFQMLDKLVSRKHFSFTKVNKIFVKCFVYNYRSGPRLWAFQKFT